VGPRAGLDTEARGRVKEVKLSCKEPYQQLTLVNTSVPRTLGFLKHSDSMESFVEKTIGARPQKKTSYLNVTRRFITLFTRGCK
jgi:hypothetical protein